MRGGAWARDTHEGHAGARTTSRPWIPVWQRAAVERRPARRCGAV